MDCIKDLPDEEWREIKGYTRYMCSNMGRIKSLKHAEARILHTFVNNKGYERVCLSQFGKSRYWLVHRIVAETFVDNPDSENNKDIDHIDNDKSNNKASNLQWLSHSDNMKKEYRRYVNSV